MTQPLKLSDLNAGDVQYLGTNPDEAQYGTLGQQALAGLEGAGRGATFGLSDLIEKKLGEMNPELFGEEAIRKRASTNPITSTLGNMVGTGTLLAVTGGAAGPIEGALGGGLAARIAGYGIEGGALGLGAAASDAALGDPHLSAQKILAHVGMGAALGGGLGALSKAIEAAGPLLRQAKETEAVIPKAASESALSGETRYDPFMHEEVPAKVSELQAQVPGKEGYDPFTHKAYARDVSESAQAPEVLAPVDEMHVPTQEALEAAEKAKKYIEYGKMALGVAFPKTKMVLTALSYVKPVFNAIKKKTAEIENLSESIFTGARAATDSGASAMSEEEFNDVRDKVAILSSDPQKLMDHLSDNTQGLHHVAPQVTQALQSSLINGVQFLAAKMPQRPTQMYLTSEWKPSVTQRTQFNQYYQAVNQPISALHQIKKGSLSNQTMEALQAVHPNLLQEMQMNVVNHMTPEKAYKLNYAQKLSLAKFLGQPLDENMTPQAIQANQMAMNAPQQSKQTSQAQGAQTQRSTLGGLKQLDFSGRAATRTQKEDED